MHESFLLSTIMERVKHNVYYEDIVNDYFENYHCMINDYFINVPYASLSSHLITVLKSNPALWAFYFNDEDFVNEIKRDYTNIISSSSYEKDMLFKSPFLRIMFEITTM